MIEEKATYQYIPEKHGQGMFYITDCCHNQMYSAVGDEMTYHGKLCPKCMWENKTVTLYLRGTEEANEVMRERGVTKRCLN